MNKEVKKLWLEALRSGDYKQGCNLLRSRNDEFCCLGVLCDLAYKAGIVEEPEITELGDYMYERDVSLLPPKVSKWSGGVGAMGDYDGTSLVNDNDVGKTFEEIAAIIEANF